MRDSCDEGFSRLKIGRKTDETHVAKSKRFISTRAERKRDGSPIREIRDGEKWKFHLHLNEIQLSSL